MDRWIPRLRFDDGGVKQYLILTDWRERPLPETNLSEQKLGLLNWGGAKDNVDEIIEINLAKKAVEEQVSQAKNKHIPWIAFGGLGTGSITQANFDYAWQAMARSNWPDGKFPHTKRARVHNYNEYDELESITDTGGPPSDLERRTFNRRKILPVDATIKVGLTKNPKECEKIFKDFEKEVCEKLNQGWWPIDGLSCEIKYNPIKQIYIVSLSQDLYWPKDYNRGRKFSDL